MPSYADCVARLSLPTVEQSKRFAVHVARAHSWYKRLPAFPPGAPFTFFMDPEAGRDRVVLPSGEVGFADRLGVDAGLTTSDYREAFGHWNYFTPYGGGIYFGSHARGWRGETPAAAVITESGDVIAVPEGLARAGSCFLTSFIYRGRLTSAADRSILDFPTVYREFERRANESPDHPEVRDYRPLLDLVREDQVFERDYVASRGRLEAFHALEHPRQLCRLETTLAKALDWIRITLGIP